MRHLLFSIVTFLIIGAGCSSFESRRSQQPDTLADFESDLTGAPETSASVSASEPEKKEDSGGLFGGRIGRSAKAQQTVNNQKLREAVNAGDMRSVREQALSILEVEPNQVEAMNALAMSHFKSNRPKLAKMILDRALKQKNHSALRNNLGLIYLSEGKQKDALREFKEAIKLDPRNGSAAANAGAIYVEGRDYRKAATVLKIAYDNRVRDLGTLQNYAIALVATGRGNEAEPIYRELIKQKPNDESILANYAIYLIDHKKDFQEGLKQLDRLRFLGVPNSLRGRMNELEKKATTSSGQG